MATTGLLDHPARSPRVALPARVSPLLRVRVALRRFQLLRELAAGVDPLGSPELAFCARQITSPREVATCVGGVERILRLATTSPRGLTAEVPVEREAVLAARPFLLNLLARLRETENPRPVGIARTLMLLHDGCGPVYAPSPPGTLASRAFRAAEGI